MSKYNIAVLGPIPSDHITTHRGELIEKYGAAMHTAIGISKLLGDSGTVYMVSHVRKVDEAPIKQILAAYPNINTDHLTSKADQGDEIRLKFVDQNNRLEKQTGFMNPLEPADVEGLAHCDAFVCVPITDYEVPMTTLRHIRQMSEGIIIFDAHGPTTAVSVAGNRHIKFWLDRDLWLPYIDVLKMNLEESNCCWFEKSLHKDLQAHFDEKDHSHLPLFAEHVLNRGVKALIVTLDSAGSALFYKEGNEIRQEIVDAIHVENVVDTTGCGDSFAGGLGFGLLANKTDYIRAIKYANALGAQRTQGRGFDVFKDLEETNNKIIANYGRV